MPTRWSRDAPRFTGDDPLELLPFLKAFDILAKAAALKEEEKIEQLGNYASIADSELWSDLPTFLLGVWDDFKTEVIALYPGAEESRRFTITDLEDIRDQQQRSPITNQYDFGEFHRKFIRVGGWLKKKGKASEIEIHRIYWNALPTGLQNKVSRRLEIKFPNHALDIPYTAAEVQEAALWVLTGTSASKSSNEDRERREEDMRQQNGRDFRHSSATPPHTTTVKTETVDMTRMDMAQLVSLITAVTRSQQTAPVPATNNMYASAPAQQSIGQYQHGAQNAQMGPGSCYCCGNPGHTVRNCPETSRLIHERKAIINALGRLSIPNNTGIPWGPMGTTFAQRIDEYHLRNPGNLCQNREAPPHLPNITETHLVAIAEAQPEATIEELEYQAAGEAVEAEYNDMDILRMKAHMAAFAQKIVSAEGQRKKRTTNNSNRPAVSEPVSGYKPTNTSAPVEKEVVTVPLGPVAQQVQVLVIAVYPPGAPFQPAARGNVGAPSFGTTPQFRYESGIEKPAHAPDVLARLLATQTFLSFEELLSLSPSIRRHFTDLTKAKRIPVDGTTASHYQSGYLQELGEDNEDANITGKHSQPLRTITPLINGTIPVTGILDLGCQVVIIRQDIWAKLGMPLDPERIMHMESANSTTDDTMGLLPSLKFVLGEKDHQVVLTLPVQVVKTAPFECLLGRPFTALAQAVTEEFLNGDCHITLRDPNSGIAIKIPTQERVRTPKNHIESGDF